MAWNASPLILQLNTLARKHKFITNSDKDDFAQYGGWTYYQ
jgi:hypothetical protein